MTIQSPNPKPEDLPERKNEELKVPQNPPTASPKTKTEITTNPNQQTTPAASRKQAESSSPTRTNIELDNKTSDDKLGKVMKILESNPNMNSREAIEKIKRDALLISSPLPDLNIDSFKN